MSYFTGCPNSILLLQSNTLNFTIMIKVFYSTDNTIEQVGVVGVLYICIWEVPSSIPEGHQLP